MTNRHGYITALYIIRDLVLDQAEAAHAQRLDDLADELIVASWHIDDDIYELEEHLTDVNQLFVPILQNYREHFNW